MKLSVFDAARMAGKRVPQTVPAKCQCPIRQHKRKDRTFRIFRGSDGTDMWKCWSCDEPENSGDGLKLFALLTGRDRKEAFREFRDRGFDFGDPSKLRHSNGSHAKRFTEVLRSAAEDLPLSPRQVEAWMANDMTAVNTYLRRRGLPEQEDWREWGVLSLGGDYLGFMYRDPDTGRPCRVKARGMAEKRFWNEPRPDPARPGAKAKAPLWRADRLVVGEPVIIVEGEMDALTLAALGFQNVVSLPDGSESAITVDLRVIRECCPEWIVATDDDLPGERAWFTLRERANGTGNTAVRRRFWRGTERFKDANDALVAGLTPEEIGRCLSEEMPQSLQGAA